jgi:hypothetical protein
MLPPDATAFRDWLEAIPPLLTAGRAGTADDDPLVRFLAEREPESHPAIGGMVLFTGHVGERVGRLLPAWAQAWEAELNRGGVREVTAREALRLLDRAQERGRYGLAPVGEREPTLAERVARLEAEVAELKRRSWSGR